MKVIFLDFDGVLINRESLRQASGQHSKAHPGCVAALNKIIQETGACIVVSSSWRGKYVSPMRDLLKQWGVRGKVIGVTPRLERNPTGRNSIYLAHTRGDEIRAWLDEYERVRGPVESIVILDDEQFDLDLFVCRLVRTDYAVGLTLEDADKAITLLQGQSREEPKQNSV